MVDLSNIVIESPVGQFEIQSKPIIDLVKHCVTETENEYNLKHKNIFNFFGDIKPDNEYHAIRSNEVGAYLKCLMNVLEEEYEIINMTDYATKADYEIPVSYHEFDVGPKKKESLPLKANIFVKHKESEIKYVFSLLPYHDTDGPQLEIEVFFDSTQTSFRQFWDKVENYFNTKGPLMKQRFNTHWKYIDYEQRTWDSIVMLDKMKEVLGRNIVNFLKHLEEYRKNGLPTSRGILITGPPGTGKTLCCETIMSIVDCTSIYVTGDSVDSVGDIKRVYEIARRLSPTIVIIEDIDTLGGLDRRERGSHPLLSEFLNCLNGMGRNEGVITIATTNYPDHLDAALSDRPGRFDVRLDFGLPDKKIREHILNKYLGEIEFEGKLNIHKIVNETDGLSGAYLREIIMTAYMISLEKERKLNQRILEQALGIVLNTKKQVKESYGFITPSEELYS